MAHVAESAGALPTESPDMSVFLSHPEPEPASQHASEPVSQHPSAPASASDSESEFAPHRWYHLSGNALLYVMYVSITLVSLAIFGGFAAWAAAHPCAISLPSCPGNDWNDLFNNMENMTNMTVLNDIPPTWNSLYGAKREVLAVNIDLAPSTTVSAVSTHAVALEAKVPLLLTTLVTVKSSAPAATYEALNVPGPTTTSVAQEVPAATDIDAAFPTAVTNVPDAAVTSAMHDISAQLEHLLNVQAQLGDQQTSHHAIMSQDIQTLNSALANGDIDAALKTIGDLFLEMDQYEAFLEDIVHCLNTETGKDNELF